MAPSIKDYPSKRIYRPRIPFKAQKASGNGKAKGYVWEGVRKSKFGAILAFYRDILMYF